MNLTDKNGLSALTMIEDLSVRNANRHVLHEFRDILLENGAMTRPDPMLLFRVNGNTLSIDTYYVPCHIHICCEKICKIVKALQQGLSVPCRVSAKQNDSYCTVCTGWQTP